MLGFYMVEFRDVLNVYVNHIIYSCSIIGYITWRSSVVCAWDCLTFVSRKRCKSEAASEQLDKKCFVIFIRGTKRVTERRNDRLDRRDFVEFLKDPTWIHVGGPLSLSLSFSRSSCIINAGDNSQAHKNVMPPFLLSGLRSFSLFFLYVLYCCLNGARFLHPRKGRSYIHGDEDLSPQIPSLCIYLLIHSFSFKLFSTKLFFDIRTRISDISFSTEMYLQSFYLFNNY